MIRSLLLIMGLITLAPASSLRAGNCGSRVKAPTPRGLVVSGRIQNGAGTLAPAYPMPWLPDQPGQGAYSLVFLDAKGGLLNKVPFNPPAGSQEGPPDPQGTPFSLVVPFTEAMKAGLVSVELFQGKQRLATLHSSHQRAWVAPLYYQPVARVVGPGIVRLVWDDATHPGALVKDGESGDILAVAEGGTVDLKTLAWELDVTLSDGVRSLTTDVRILPPAPARSK